MDFQENFVQLSPNLIYFLISSAVAYIAFGLIAIWYVWPAIKDHPAKAALTPLLLYACLRVNGLMFLMPGSRRRTFRTLSRRRPPTVI
jgi:hypothetical protein